MSQSLPRRSCRPILRFTAPITQSACAWSRAALRSARAASFLPTCTERPGYDGVKFAVVQGDPAKPGLYVIRAKFSPGAMTKPHWHQDERYVTVLQGTWYTGEGDKFEPEKTVPLKAGGFMLHPAKAHHYDGAKDEEVIVQIVGIGPSSTTLIDPAGGNTGRSKK
jgi:gentisate 1,2-dioxygenase